MRLAALTLAVVTALGITGCGPRATIPSLPPEPSGTPLFETEEEALDAAEAAYTAYLATSDLIAQEGGVDPERIAAVATGELYESALESFELLRDQGWHATGATRIAGILLQDADLSGAQEIAVVVAYLCLDFSGFDVVDGGGTSMVSPDRPDLQSFEVAFDLSAQGDGLKPSSRLPWGGEGPCEF